MLQRRGGVGPVPGDGRDPDTALPARVLVLRDELDAAAAALGDGRAVLVDDLEEDGGGRVGPHRAELPRRRPPDADLHVGDARRVLLVAAVARADGTGNLEKGTEKIE